MKPDAINIEKLAQQKSEENWDFHAYLVMEEMKASLVDGRNEPVLLIT